MVTTKEGVVEAPKPTPQRSLFDKEEEPAVVIEEEIPSTITSLADTTDSYELVDTKEGIEKIVTEVFSLKEFGFALICDGEDAMKAIPRGVAIATAIHKAYYVPIVVDELEILKPIFEDRNLTLIGNNIKFDLIVLRNKGIKLAEPHFDTAIAHYLIQPEQGHDSISLAESRLT